MKSSLVVALVFLLGAVALADAPPPGWACTGNCGTLGADGVVTVSPIGSGKYAWVSTANGIADVGSLPGVGGAGVATDGSVLATPVFAANGGDVLDFYFNYVTSDGGTFVDYAWVQLVNAADLSAILLFTARTTPGGDTVPGFSMPPVDPNVTLVPPTTLIIDGAPAWSPLGFYGDGFHCWLGSGQGCGYTGWIESLYTIQGGGNYFLQFGVTNWDDQIFDSGLAIDGIKVGGHEIEDEVPEPGSILLLGTGLFGLAGALRRRMRA